MTVVALGVSAKRRGTFVVVRRDGSQTRYVSGQLLEDNHDQCSNEVPKVEAKTVDAG